MKKRCLSLCLCVCLILVLLPAASAVELADNEFPSFGTAMGYYLEEKADKTTASYDDRSKDPMSYDELLQCAQEYVDLLVARYPFMQVKDRKDLSWSGGGNATYYLRYTGTVGMTGNLQQGDYISWKNYGPYHLKVRVWHSNTNYITMAWDEALEPVETDLRTPTGARLGKERPSLTVVLACGYGKMCVGDQVVQVDDADAAVCPVKENGRTLVPVSRIVEALGGKSSWDGASRTATFTLGDAKVVVPIGSTRITVDGKSQTIDAAAKISHSRTYVPLRAVLEGLGCWVGYESKHQLVVVSTDDLSGEDLVKLKESQRLFASEEIPKYATRIVERYTSDGTNYPMEVGEALTLFNSYKSSATYYSYTWEVVEGGELVSLDQDGPTCQFYAKRPGVVTLKSHVDETWELGLGSFRNNSRTYTMTITISPASGNQSSSKLMKWQTCPSCNGRGKIRVGTSERDCPTCGTRGSVLLP